MAIAVPSTSNSGGYAATAVIPKPTGLQVGDTLIALIESSSGSGSLNTPAGWTVAVLGSWSLTDQAIYYKVADAGDVAAADFTFTDTVGTRMGGALLRVTGLPPSVIVSDFEAIQELGANSATIALDCTVAPTHALSLVVVIVSGHNTGTSPSSISAFVSTPAITFTEVFDQEANVSAVDPVAAGAYGIQASLANITNFGATIANSREDHHGVIAVFTPQGDAAGTAALLVDEPEFFAPAATVGGTGTNALLVAEPEIPDPVGRETHPTPWTAPSKTSTIWTPESK